MAKSWLKTYKLDKLGPKSSSEFLNVLLRFNRFVAFCISVYVSFLLQIRIMFRSYFGFEHSLNAFSCLKRFRDRDPGSKPFFWTAVLLGLMIYIVAIYLTQIVLVYRVEGDIGLSLEPYFGSVPQQGAPACSALKLFHLGKFGVYFLVFKADGTGYQWTRKSRLMKT